jgi:hypothetical protein
LLTKQIFTKPVECISIETVEVAVFVTGLETLQIQRVLKKRNNEIITQYLFNSKFQNCHLQRKCSCPIFCDPLEDKIVYRVFLKVVQKF